MKKKVLLFVLIGALVILLTAAFQMATEQIRISNVHYSDLTLKAFVTDNGGRLESAQPLAFIDDTSLYDVSVQRLQEQKDVPMAVLFVVDVKKNNFASEQKRAQQVINLFMENQNIKRDEKSVFFVMEFGDKAKTPYDPKTNHGNILLTEDSSNYYAAIKPALEMMQARQEANSLESQLIVLITDGVVPLNHLEDKEALKTQVRAAGIPMIGIVTLNREGIIEKKDLDGVSEIVDAIDGPTYKVTDFVGPNGNSQMVDTIVMNLFKRSLVVTGRVPLTLVTNPDNIYSVKVAFESNGSQVASVVKPKNHLPNLMENVISAILTLTPPTPTDEDTTVTVTVGPTPPPNGDPWWVLLKEWLNKETPVLDYMVKNWALALVGVAVVGLILFLILHNRNSGGDFEPNPYGYDDEDPFPSDTIAAPVPSDPVTGPVTGPVPAPVMTPGPMYDSSPTVAVSNLPAAHVSFENMDKSKMEAPIREQIESGAEKIFGRRTAPGVIGMNGDESMSKVHFKLVFVDSTLYIEDMASSNGVILNGTRIQTRARLRDKDILLIGRTTYRVHVNTQGGYRDRDDDRTQLYF